MESNDDEPSAPKIGDIATPEDYRAAIGDFLTEFASFESLYVTAVIDALCNDTTLVEFVTELMALGDRLKLVKYLGDARGLPKDLQEKIASARSAANKLLPNRNLVAHNALQVTVLGGGVVFGGLRMPRSKRPWPNRSVSAQELLDVMTTWHVTLAEIRKYIEDTRELQETWEALRGDIQLYRNLTGWNTAEGRVGGDAVPLSDILKPGGSG